jgi:putative membrane protein
MKSLTSLKALLIVGLFTIACEPSRKGDDSVEIAEEINDENLDDRDIEKDADFVVSTVAANYAGIELARLAINRSSDEEIKSIARQLETDHSAIINELKEYADRNGIIVPAAESNDQLNERNKLAEKDADDFDEELCKMLVDNHEEAVDNFEERVDKTEDSELKSWISKTLPTLKSHLNTLKEHEKKQS